MARRAKQVTPQWVGDEPMMIAVHEPSRTLFVTHNSTSSMSWRDGRTLLPVVPGGERQRELAYRFGVNMVMYALTGNYKADQVHVPYILERLGQ